MTDADLVFFARRTHERFEVLATAMSNAVLHTGYGYTRILSMIGAIIFLRNTGVDK